MTNTHWKVMSQTFIVLKNCWRTSSYAVHFCPVRFWHASGGGWGLTNYFGHFPEKSNRFFSKCFLWEIGFFGSWTIGFFQIDKRFHNNRYTSIPQPVSRYSQVVSNCDWESVLNRLSNVIASTLLVNYLLDGFRVPKYFLWMIFYRFLGKKMGQKMFKNLF